jgi:hypothetical protein
MTIDHVTQRRPFAHSPRGHRVADVVATRMGGLFNRRTCARRGGRVVDIPAELTIQPSQSGS